MADIRIKDLATTAASTASDDFVAVDGSANGTRKLNAYSPTFGGNLTVSGTGTYGGAINANADGTNIVFKTFGTTPQSALWTNNDGTMTWGDYATGTKSLKLNTTNGNATLGGNLTVSGTGTSSFGGTNQISNVLSVGATNVANSQALYLSISQRANYGYALLGYNLTGTDGTDAYTSPKTGTGTFGLELQNSGIARFVYSTAATTAGSTVSVTEAARFVSGNFLLKSDGVDSGNGKLQLATHTTSAGGIGLGTDTALYRTAAGRLLLQQIGGTSPLFGLSENGTTTAEFQSASGDVYLTANTAGKSLILRTVGTTALTLDSSQNATFAGKVTATTALISSDYVQCDATGAYNLGNPTTDGTWRFVISGTGNLLIQRRESGAFVTKSTISA